MRVLESLAHRRDLRALKMLSWAEVLPWLGQREAGREPTLRQVAFRLTTPGSMREPIAREVLAQFRLEIDPVRPYFSALDGCGLLR